jgi:mono/diheme cytochrome c family protein
MPTPRIRTIVFSAIVLMTAADLTPAQNRAPKQDYNSGEYLCRTFCASCHGESLRGDGPAAPTLRQPATDLTQLAARAGGTFPRDQVTRIIDGRQPLTAHDTPDMPKWGQVMQRLEDDERLGQRRIAALVNYLESMQRK